MMLVDALDVRADDDRLHGIADQIADHGHAVHDEQRLVVCPCRARTAQQQADRAAGRPGAADIRSGDAPRQVSVAVR